MSTYLPDAWVVLKIRQGKTVAYKVFAGWYGGYLGSDSWKLNSGITVVEKDGDNYLFSGHSGSTYVCHKNCYRMTGLMHSVFAGFVKEIEKAEDAELVVFPEETEFEKISYAVDS